jgi:NitT/TauT family transport system substrate-binding protein
MRKLITLVFLAAAFAAAGAYAQAPAAKSPAGKIYDVCWSHYTGWEPWAYADEKGLLKKWGDKYGIGIRLTLVNDYVESVNLYTAGKYQACAMTNMDALTIPAVGGVDSTALIIGDFSNGNDGIVIKNGKSVKDLKGQKVKLVQLSVSHYLLSRALTMNGMTEKDVTLVNTSDADIGSLFLAEKTGAAVTWNPILLKVRSGKGVSLIFDSSKTPGEIIDMMVIRTDAPDALKRALTGAWYDTMAVMSGSGKPAKDAIAFMAAKAGGTVAEFEAQLKSTAMFYKSAEAAKFTTSPKLKETMEFVRTFSFEKGLFGQGARSKDAVGIRFPDGSILGNPKNVKLRFDATYMQLAADGKL